MAERTEAAATDSPTAELPPPVPIGRRRQPRTLLMTDDETFAAAVAEMVPTCERIEHCREVEESEFDLLVATHEFAREEFGLMQEPAGHLYVISFVTGYLGTAQGGAERAGAVNFGAGSRSREYNIPSKVPPELARLIRDDLLAAVQQREGYHAHLGAAADASLVPLLQTPLDDILGGVAVRSGNGVLLALPDDVKDRAGWVKAGLQLFRRLDPHRFREVPGWEERPTWRTANERRLHEELDKSIAERERVLATFAAREEALKGQLAQAAADADAGLRRLLTAQGDDLERAVKQALESLGFEVTRMDTFAEAGNKLEDLRVQQPGEDGWMALGEVKGKSRGASLSDIMGTVRFVKRYRDETGEWPDAVWYVVNQYAGQDPARRDRVLSSQERELEQWAEETGGLAIDTADLFQLVVAVERGDVDAVEARRQLLQARKRYEFSDPSAGQAEAHDAEAS